jgi:hypothetical protein
MSRKLWSSGEIATLLAVVSMIIIGVGITLGLQLNKASVNTQSDASQIKSSSNISILKKIFTQDSDNTATGPTPTVTPATPINKDPKSIWFERESPQVCSGGFICRYDPIIRKLELRRPNGDVIIELDKAINSNYILGVGNRDKRLTPYGITIDKCPNTSKGLSVEYNPDVIKQYYSDSNHAPIKELLVNKDGSHIIEPEKAIIFATTSNTVPPNLYFIYEKPDNYSFGTEPVTLYFEYDAQLTGVRQRYSQTVEILPGCIQPSVTPSPTPSKGPSPTPSVTPSVTPSPTTTPTPSVGPSPTPSATPTIGPSITPSPTPAKTSCTFKSLAFVQECTQWADKDKGICAKNDKGFNIGKPILEPQYRLDAQAPQHDLATGTWSITNNKSQKSKLTYSPGLKDQFGNAFTGSAIEVKEFNPQGWENSDADIKIAIDPKRYQFLPKDGKEIRKSTPVGPSDRFNSPANVGIQDTIHGIKVACNQDIEYGWTLQRCENSFDYVFVMDTSSSMVRFNDPWFGKRKLDVLKDNMELVLKDIANEATTAGPASSRAALITFNENATTLRDFSTDFNDLRKVVSTGLVPKEGTCIECGLNQAYQLIQNRQDKSRTPVVIFLTDGLPNSHPGGPHPKEGYQPLIDRQVENLKLINGITIAAIGYGDPNLNVSDPDILPGGQFYDMIKKIATDETWAFSTDTSKAAAAGSINQIYSRITSRLNSCAKTNDFIAAIQKSADINGDGFVNTADLTRIFDSYFKQTTTGAADELAEDVNNDGVVNAIDASVVIENIGVQVRK